MFFREAENLLVEPLPTTYNQDIFFSFKILKFTFSTELWLGYDHWGVDCIHDSNLLSKNVLLLPQSHLTIVILTIKT